MSQKKIAKQIGLLALGSYLIIACVAQGKLSHPNSRHEWWTGFGPVVPHDTFPADCTLCHIPDNWQEMVEGFTFDHEAETGVPLRGAHKQASCLRCHNDRGPVVEFVAQGCAGCHEDIHLGQLGPNCRECHQQKTWQPDTFALQNMHNRTRFPLVGAHAVTSCRRCHIGAEIGRFFPTDVECVTCHQDDLNRALNPNHIALGFVDNCNRCHIPTTWNQAELP